MLFRSGGILRSPDFIWWCVKEENWVNSKGLVNCKLPILARSLLNQPQTCRAQQANTACSRNGFLQVHFPFSHLNGLGSAHVPNLEYGLSAVDFIAGWQQKFVFIWFFQDLLSSGRWRFFVIIRAGIFI